MSLVSCLYRFVLHDLVIATFEDGMSRAESAAAYVQQDAFDLLLYEYIRLSLGVNIAILNVHSELRYHLSKIE